MALWRGAAAALRGLQLPRRRWGLAAVVSLGLHLIGGPALISRILHPPERELDVTYVALADDQEGKASESETTSPPPTEDPEQPPEPDRRKPAEKKPEKKPDPVEKKPFEVVPLPNLPLVDQDQFPDEQDNPEARFMAQNNHRAAEDVQAKDRTLDKAAPPPPEEPTPQNPALPPAPPAAQALAAAPPPAAQQPQPASGQAGAPLAMRGAPGELQGEALPQEQGGTTVVAGTQSSPAGRAGGPQTGPSQLALKNSQYDQIVGQEVAESERRLGALAERPRVPNRWDRLLEKQNMIRGALENFLPHVRVGNQSELGTRKHPFAAFIATMHRQIHRYWGDGFLADLDRKTGRDAYPDSLESSIEIVVRNDGVLDGMTIARPSGSLPFDTAALDAVSSAAPFPTPPDAIKSRDGKVYLTWHFHRDERQCHPNYVDMHILTTPPKATPSPGKVPLSPEKPTEPGRLRLAGGAGPGSTTSSPGKGDASSHGATRAPETSPPPASPARTTVPPEARRAAERWVEAFQKGDVGWLIGVSGLPFTAGGKTIADDGPTLRAFYRELLAEGAGANQGLKLYTPAEIRGRLGRLPAGADEPDMAFAYVDLAGDDLVLLLAPSERGWSVVGVNRQ